MPRRGCWFALLTVGALAPAARPADLPPGAVLRIGEARFRAGGPVAELVFSADGSELVAHVPAVGGDRVTVWDAATGELLRAGVPPRTAGVRVRWGANAIPGTDFGVVIADGAAVVRDFAAKQDRARLSGHAARVTAVAVSPDGRRLATASADGLIRTWDARTFRPLSTPSGHLGPVRTVEVSPDGRLALTTGADRSARIWDIATGRELRAFALDETAAATFAAGSAAVKLRTPDGVRVRDLVTGVEMIPTDPPAADPLTPVRVLLGVCAALSPDGRVLAVGRAGGGINLIETATLGVRRQLGGVGPACRDVAFTPDGSRLLTAGPGEGVVVWPVRVRDMPLTAELKRETSAAKLWDQLAAPDAAAAYAAMARLAADPSAAAKMARLRLGTTIDPLAESRAVELLESLNTPEARAHLRELAADGTVTAARALSRLGEPRAPLGDIRRTGGTVP